MGGKNWARQARGGGPVRIIAGEARGRKLATLPGQHTRPTLERVKEGIFSAVQFWLPGARVLDLFAGGGQLGLEAVSRGAAGCTFVEQDAKAAALIGQNAKAVGLEDRCRVTRSEVYAFLARGAGQFDLILMDPPYHEGFYPGVLEAAAKVAAPGCLALCESEPEAQMPAEAAGFVLEKQYRYGTVLVSRYKMTAESEDSENQ
ncbi:16S rRNA (guanine(966)-N(2))-methyltransferase RsmD [Ruminococcaceae bacterium OttesenSCG-928-D13]|nr:16S rRNA (guanine(966)-N(2))-methyltransferase RsmD [Ruminococcaceae bacterium OttesenSCG-928-D13]